MKKVIVFVFSVFMVAGCEMPLKPKSNYKDVISEEARLKVSDEIIRMDSVNYYQKESENYYNRKYYSLALTQINKAISIEKNNPELLAWRAGVIFEDYGKNVSKNDLLNGLKDVNDALTIYSDLKQVKSENYSNCMLLKGVALSFIFFKDKSQIEISNEALNCFNEANNYFKNRNGQLLFQRAILLLHLGKNNSGCENLKMAVKLNYISEDILDNPKFPCR